MSVTNIYYACLSTGNHAKKTINADFISYEVKLKAYNFSFYRQFSEIITKTYQTLNQRNIKGNKKKKGSQLLCPFLSDYLILITFNYHTRFQIFNGVKKHGKYFIVDCTRKCFSRRNLFRLSGL